MWTFSITVWISACWNSILISYCRSSCSVKEWFWISVKPSLKTYWLIIRLLRKFKPFFLVCSSGPFSLSHGDSSQVKDLWFLFLFPCPLIKLAVRCPEADASPTDCQARKKIHLHWLLYLQWFLKPSKKTTVILASKQLKSTGAGNMHSPKINMTWEERGVGEQRKVLFIQRNLFLLNICNVQPIAQEATWPYFPTNGRAGWSWADAWVACGVRRTVCQEDQYLLFFYLCGESLLFLKKKIGGGCALTYRAWVWLQVVNQLRTAMTSQTGLNVPHPLPLPNGDMFSVLRSKSIWAHKIDSWFSLFIVLHSSSVIPW